MAKFYGSVVGTPRQSGSFAGLSPAYQNGRVARLVRDTWTGDAAQNDTVQLVDQLRWDTTLDEFGVINFSDFGTGVNLNVGFPNDADALIAAQDVSTAAGSAAILKSVAIANRHKPLWALAGYASLEAAKAASPFAEIIATFVDANPASGTLAWDLYGSPQ